MILSRDFFIWGYRTSYHITILNDDFRQLFIFDRGMLKIRLHCGENRSKLVSYRTKYISRVYKITLA
jgi:hypothetical protein